MGYPCRRIITYLHHVTLSTLSHEVKLKNPMDLPASCGFSNLHFGFRSPHTDEEGQKIRIRPRLQRWAAGCKVGPTGLFRVRVIIHPPGISLLDGPILKPFEVVIDHSHWFCFVYLDGLHVGNYPSKICHDFWTVF